MRAQAFSHARNSTITITINLTLIATHPPARCDKSLLLYLSLHLGSLPYFPPFKILLLQAHSAPRISSAPDPTSRDAVLHNCDVSAIFDVSTSRTPETSDIFDTQASSLMRDSKSNLLHSCSVRLSLSLADITHSQPLAKLHARWPREELRSAAALPAARECEVRPPSPLAGPDLR